MYKLSFPGVFKKVLNTTENVEDKSDSPSAKRIEMKQECKTGIDASSIISRNLSTDFLS